MEQDQPVDKKGIVAQVKPFVIEIVIIFILSACIIGILNFFKIIDVSMLFSSPQNTKPSIVNQQRKNNPATKIQNKPVNSFANITSPSQPDINLVVKAKALKYAQLLTSFEGTVVAVDTNPGFDTDLNATYSAKLIIKVGTDNDTVKLLYSKESLDRVKVTDADKKLLKLTSLKSGDKVAIRTNIGLLRAYPNNINEVVITKL